ncbi:MAG TPA: DoxX family protein [Sphingomicrobium sp.]|nr:DoxX family protein [Sphingomicrobium sp.]
MATQTSELDAPSPTSQNIGDIASLTGRVLISALFLLSGFSKIAAPAATIGYIGSAGLPLPSLGFAIAVAIEIPVSLALVLGYRARVAAALMAVFSIAAAIAFHSNLSDQNQLVHFFKNVAITGGLLQIVAFGAGRLSLDARRRRAD